MGSLACMFLCNNELLYQNIQVLLLLNRQECMLFASNTTARFWPWYRHSDGKALQRVDRLLRFNPRGREPEPISAIGSEFLQRKAHLVSCEFEGAGVLVVGVFRGSRKITGCRRDQFLARVTGMSSSLNQKNAAHICCCMCCAQVSSGAGRLVI